MTEHGNPNGAPYFRPSTQAQGLAKYPHARIIPAGQGKGSYIYVSGTSSRRADGTFVGADTTVDGSTSLDIRLQTAAVLSNIDAIIQGATSGHAGIRNVIDATVFLTNMKDDYAGMNEEWNRVWPVRTNGLRRGRRWRCELCHGRRFWWRLSVLLTFNKYEVVRTKYARRFVSYIGDSEPIRSDTVP